MPWTLTCATKTHLATAPVTPRACPAQARRGRWTSHRLASAEGGNRWTDRQVNRQTEGMTWSNEGKTERLCKEMQQINRHMHGCMDGCVVCWLVGCTHTKKTSTLDCHPQVSLQDICTYLYGTQGPRLAVLGLPSQVLAVAWADQHPSEACLHNERWNICATSRIHDLCHLLTNDLWFPASWYNKVPY